MEKVVFTNGCFDLLHPGHIELLTKARSLGSKLIVGINSDNSIRRIKGHPRPFMNQEARYAILKGLKAVDEVQIFDENTPQKIIEKIKPDVLVKGGDWSKDEIIGADFVLRNGGQVLSIPFESDFSSSRIVEKIKGSKTQENLEAENGKINFTEKLFTEKIEIFKLLLKNEIQNINDCAELIRETISTGNKVIFNGDDSIKFVTRFLVSQFNKSLEQSEQKILACNLVEQNSDFLKDEARKGDILVTFSIGGSHPEILQPILRARQINCKTIGVCGESGKKLTALCDNSILISSGFEDHIIESMFIIGNLWLASVGNNLFTKPKVLNEHI